MEGLLEATLLKRYKRFLADCILEGEEVTAHVPNSGSMTSTWEEGCEALLTKSDNPKRKLKYTLEFTKMHDSWVCVNTGLANKLVTEGIENGTISQLQGYESITPEQKYGTNSRIDLLLEKGDQKCFVEIKSVSLRLDDTLAFPDAVTKRGTKHLHELIEVVKQGDRAVMLFLINRTDSDAFTIAKQIDPEYFDAMQKAIEAGVEVLVYQARFEKGSDYKITTELALTL